MVPPLRERRDDLPALIEFLLAKFSARLGKPIAAVASEAMDLLLKYAYPGNVRELENIIERALILARHEAIYVEDLPLHLRERISEDTGTRHIRQSSLPEAVHTLERHMILRALEQHAGVQTRAAAELGISERVLRYKSRKHHLPVELESATGEEAQEALEDNRVRMRHEGT